MNPDIDEIESLREQIRLLEVENQRLKAENRVHQNVKRAYSNTPEYFPDCFKYGFGFGRYAPIWYKARA